jgi:imidazolonepropionase-like amidohydrolase
VPPTSDVGLGVAQRQLPRSLIGASVALRELLVAARNHAPAADFGPYAALDLAVLVQQRVPWLVAAGDAAEIRAALALAADFGLNLVINEATYAGDVADDIAARGAAVVYKPPFNPDSSLFNRGKSADARWPESDVAARLARAGVRLAVAPGSGASPRDLRFAAFLAMRGGLQPANALRAITLTPAELYGVADRVGSIEPGKDADLVVLNGRPLDMGSSVVSTWSDGETVWAATASQDDGAPIAPPVVIQVEELHIGDGHVLRPGQILLQDGKIAEIGERVARPNGAVVVRGAAAMPGIVDALGHLGLEGSARSVGVDYKLSRLLGPGDVADRRVARAGVTTVCLSVRNPSPSGVPIVAYKPAASDFDALVVREPTGVRLRWSDRNRSRSGSEVKELLDKLGKYQQKWAEYEKALASWKPAGSKGDDAKSAEAKADAKDESAKKDGDEKSADAGASDAKSDGGDEKKDEKADADKKDEKKDDKKKKDEPEPADPVTGVWEGEFTLPAPLSGKAKLRLQLLNENGVVRGSLRCDAVSERLVQLQGTWGAAESGAKELQLSGAGSQGPVQFAAAIAKAKMAAVLGTGAWQADVDAEQKSKEYPIAARPKSKRAQEGGDAAAAPAEKGKPVPPRIDERLEPLRQAALGKASVIVEVDRADEIAACVDAFDAAGLKPVLYGAEEAWKLKDKLAGRVSGVLLDLPFRRSEPARSINFVNRYVELQSGGIPVAFHSSSEEGAAELLTRAMYMVSQGMSASGALRALTSDAARMLGVSDRVGMLKPGLDADVVLLDASPLAEPARVLRAWVNGSEVLP